MQPDMLGYICVAAGAAMGGVAWLGFSTAIHRLGAGNFPWANLFANFTGSALIGCLAANERTISPQVRLLLMTGLRGGYTTFSTFSLQTLRLIEEGYLLPALANCFLSVSLCIGGVWLGQQLGGHLAPEQKNAARALSPSGFPKVLSF
jgi:CrcB protein